MLRHIVTDLHEHYVNEVLKPKLGSPSGQSTADGPGRSDGPGNQPGNQGSDKRIRQAVYDIRYRARREEIPIQSAFTQYMAHTSMNAMEKKSVREKLGLDKPGGAGAPAAGGDKGSAPQQKNEEFDIAEDSKQRYKVRVTDKESGKTYFRMATREKIGKLRANPFISSVEMTKHGKTYEGGEDEKPANKDYDGDGKVESGAKEYRGVIHNKIQQKKGGKPDGKDTSSVKEGMSTDIEDPNDLKKAVAKAVKRVDTNVSGDVNKKDKSMGEFGEFVPSPDGKKKVVTKIAAVKEEFSNWREELSSSEEDQNVDTIKEMPRGKKNKIKFNPEVAIENLVTEKGGEILEVKEVENVEEGIKGALAGAGLAAAVAATGMAAKAPSQPTSQSPSAQVNKATWAKKHPGLAAKEASKKKPTSVKDQLSDIRGMISRSKERQRQQTEEFEKSELGEGKTDRPLGVMHSLARGVKQKKGEKSEKKYGMDSEGNRVGKYVKGGSRAVYPEQFEKSDWRSELNPVDEKMNLATADMGDVIKDFYKSDAPQFKGKSKEEIRKMAIAAKLDAERGIDEVTRYAKETGKDFTTGQPSAKPGTRTGDSAFDKVSREMRKTGGMMSSRGKAIQPQGKKKERGAKGYKGVTPVDRIKNKLAQKRAPKPNPYRPRMGESD